VRGILDGYQPPSSREELEARYAAGERLFPNTQLTFCDLRGLDVPGADFTGSNFSYSYMAEVNISGGCLNGAKLHWSRLWGANLSNCRAEAEFFGADLRSASLEDAKMARAIFVAADLSFANLRDAKLNRANLLSARTDGADWRGAELEFAYVADASMLSSGDKSIFAAEWDALGIEEGLAMRADPSGWPPNLRAAEAFQAAPSAPPAAGSYHGGEVFLGVLQRAQETAAARQPAAMGATGGKKSKKPQHKTKILSAIFDAVMFEGSTPKSRLLETLADTLKEPDNVSEVIDRISQLSLKDPLPREPVDLVCTFVRVGGKWRGELRLVDIDGKDLVKPWTATAVPNRWAQHKNKKKRLTR